ncbi:MAG: hypothetical protein IKQ61_03145, partial [Spirochaetales bacterium]|nr:hypothetical protein [Spirochaetales bacterium]
KAAAYIAIVVFILTIEVQYLSMVFCAADKEIFIFKQLFSSCCCKNLFFSLSLVVSLITFVIGIVLLVVCVFSLLARKVRVMGQDKLANCYHADSKNIDYAWECIIDGSIKAGIITEECNERLETFIKVASVLLSVIIYSFILSSIFVFFMRILYI